jgi:hypothetical protein
MMMIMMTDVSNVPQCLNVNRIHFRQYGVDTASLHQKCRMAWRFSTFAAQGAAISCVLMFNYILLNNTGISMSFINTFAKSAC